MCPAERSVPHRALAHLAWRARRAREGLRRGDRRIIMTPREGLRFGNWLYLWLDAHQRQVAGSPTLVRHVTGMELWLAEFPRLSAMTIQDSALRFHDRREWDDTMSWSQRFGTDFTRETLARFIGDVFTDIAPQDPERLVVNVRRGDYYQRPELQQRYGFDQVGYLSAALDVIGEASDALVVSDDPEWCRIHLTDTLRRRGIEPRYMTADPASNFRAVAGARRLVGMNSTFSYWGAYIASASPGGAQVVFPRFHARTPEGSDAHQLDPRWIILDGYA